MSLTKIVPSQPFSDKIVVYYKSIHMFVNDSVGEGSDFSSKGLQKMPTFFCPDHITYHFMFFFYIGQRRRSFQERCFKSNLGRSLWQDSITQSYAGKMYTHVSLCTLVGSIIIFSLWPSLMKDRNNESAIIHQSSESTQYLDLCWQNHKEIQTFDCDNL